MAQIQAQVNEVDEAMHKQTSGDDDDNLEPGASKGIQELISSSPSEPPVIASSSSFEKGKKMFGVSILRSQQPPVTLSSLESLGVENLTFQNFCARLATWINRMFPMYGCPFVPGVSHITLQADDKVSFASDLVW